MTQQDPPQQIIADEDWKARVKAENAALDQAAAQAPPAASGGAAAATRQTGGPQRGRQLPAGTFETLVNMLSAQAAFTLGLVRESDERPPIDLEAATHFIDLLAVLEAKTAGNLSHEEADLLANVLHTLRMAYVEVSRNAPAQREPAKG
jgi:hypothetical protein